MCPGAGVAGVWCAAGAVPACEIQWAHRNTGKALWWAQGWCRPWCVCVCVCVCVSVCLCVVCTLHSWSIHLVHVNSAQCGWLFQHKVKQTLMAVLTWQTLPFRINYLDVWLILCMHKLVVYDQHSHNWKSNNIEYDTSKQCVKTCLDDQQTLWREDKSTDRCWYPTV